ncbi:MAG TPA: hypothetical protein VMV48_09410 [Gallionellaceae bacterium]|nr:hypothetical protein [Gallionellaceae bacterium]
MTRILFEKMNSYMQNGSNWWLLFGRLNVVAEAFDIIKSTNRAISATYSLRVKFT